MNRVTAWLASNEDGLARESAVRLIYSGKLVPVVQRAFCMRPSVDCWGTVKEGRSVRRWAVEDPPTHIRERLER